MQDPRSVDDLLDFGTVVLVASAALVLAIGVRVLASRIGIPSAGLLLVAAAIASDAVERLSTILAGDEQHAVSRGEAVRVGLPEDEMLQARRRVERLVSDAGISDPTELDDERLAAAVQVLADEEHEVSAARAEVIGILDTLQDELKRRYKEDPTLVLR